jgi:hypothetical protein
LSKLGFREHIYGKYIIYTARVEYLYRMSGKAALRRLGRALHINYDGMGGNLFFNDFLCIHFRLASFEILSSGESA